jgi:hypothetical protein
MRIRHVRVGRASSFPCIFLACISSKKNYIDLHEINISRHMPFFYTYTKKENIQVAFESTTLTHNIMSEKKKGKAIPVTGREGPWCCETSRLPHFLYTIGSQTAVRLSAGGRPLPPRKIPGTNFC